MSGEVDSTWDHRGDFFDRKHPQTHRSLLLEIRHLKKNNVENKCNLNGGGGGAQGAVIVNKLSCFYSINLICFLIEIDFKKQSVAMWENGSI